MAQERAWAVAGVAGAVRRSPQFVDALPRALCDRVRGRLFRRGRWRWHRCIGADSYGRTSEQEQALVWQRGWSRCRAGAGVTGAGARRRAQAQQLGRAQPLGPVPVRVSRLPRASGWANFSWQGFPSFGNGSSDSHSVPGQPARRESSHGRRLWPEGFAAFSGAMRHAPWFVRECRFRGRLGWPRRQRRMRPAGFSKSAYRRFTSKPARMQHVNSACRFAHTRSLPHPEGGSSQQHRSLPSLKVS